MEALQAFATRLYEARCCVLPAAKDGSKRPGVGDWQLYQTERAPIEQVQQWLQRSQGVGVVCGQVSGNLEMLEFEARAIHLVEALKDLAIAADVESIWQRLWHGYRESTPTGGLHLFLRTDGPALHNTKLARRPATEEELAANPADRIKVLIETRGEGGWVVTAPSHGSTHPNGKEWTLESGGPEHIPTFTLYERDTLYALARSLDSMPRTVATPSRVYDDESNGSRPGDHYNANTQWADILEPAGWRFVFERAGVWFLRRPGKDIGISATVNHNGADLLWVFSTSTVFESERSYDKFGAYAILNYAGDLKAAARALRPQPLEPLTKTEAAAAAADEVIGVDLRRLSAVQPEEVEWLWPGWLPRGKLVVLDGDPALGKSTLALDIAARVSSGAAFPDGELAGPLKRNVLILTAEDGLADTVTPRFKEAGGDPNHAFALVAVRGKHSNDPRTVVLPTDIPLLEEIVKRWEVALIIVDVLVAYLSGDVNSHNDASMRQVLMKLAALAESTKATLLALRHLNKSPGGSAIYRGGGSIGIIGAARAGWLVAEDPNDPSKRVMAVTKSNLAQIPPSLAYSVVRADGWNCSRIAWHGDSNYSAEQLVAKQNGNGNGTGQLERAEIWLLEQLSVGPRLADWLLGEGAKSIGVSERTLKEAKRNIGAESRRQAGVNPPVWYWHLDAEDGH